MAIISVSRVTVHDAQQQNGWWWVPIRAAIFMRNLVS